MPSEEDVMADKIKAAGLALYNLISQQFLQHQGSALSAALAILAGHLSGSLGIEEKSAHDLFVLGQKTGAAGLAVEVALNHLQSEVENQRTPQEMPTAKAHEWGYKIFTIFAATLPQMGGASPEEAVDALALALVHTVNSIEAPLPRMVQRLGVCHLAVEHEIKKSKPTSPLN